MERHKKNITNRLRIRPFVVNSGLPSIQSMTDEINSYWDILLGRSDAPINKGIMTLMEVADAYYGRACELSCLIHEKERDGLIAKNSKYVQFRTQTLRLFIEAAKRAAELGSRRVTAEQMRNGTYFN